MRFLRLTLNNIGVFQGLHSFDLDPIRRSGDSRHLTVFIGNNGAGKSTVFQALALALYGSLTQGDRISAKDYGGFMMSRLHRCNRPGISVVCDEGRVAVSFQYVQSGNELHIDVDRRWRRSGANVQESLSVLCNGEPPDVTPDEYQIWLNDLVPPGLMPLCFLDAEHLEVLASPEHRDKSLESTLRRLLGLDLVERLQADLRYYGLQQGRGQKVDDLREKVLWCQDYIAKLDAKLDQLYTEETALAETQSELESNLTEQEQRLIAEGGMYAARRPYLQKRQDELGGEIDSITSRLQEHSSELLPFALVPDLCQSISLRLVEEAEQRRRQVFKEYLQEKANEIKSLIQDDSLWHDLDVPSRERQLVAQQILNRLQGTDDAAVTEHRALIHQISEPEREQLQVWISQVLRVVSQQVRELCNRLKALQNERQEIEEDLQRAPEDDVLAPIHSEIERLEAKIADIQQQLGKIREKTGAFLYQRDEQSRQLRQEEEELATAQANQRQLELANRSRLALDAYREVLMRKRLAVWVPPRSARKCTLRDPVFSDISALK